MTTDPKRTVTVILFDGFELLDVFGPVELLFQARDAIDVVMAARQAGPVRSSQGTEVVATVAFPDAPEPDMVLLPGGLGAREVVRDAGFLRWLHEWAGGANVISSVCTGSAVLAAAGLLDGYRATSNKRAFGWVRTQGEGVEWVATARWVQDRNRWTSSGVAAGMDMTAALMAELVDPSAGDHAAEVVELELHRDAAWDPFAALSGLA